MKNPPKNDFLIISGGIFMFYLIILAKPGFSIYCISRTHSLHNLSASLRFTLIPNYPAFLECIRFLHFIVRPGSNCIAV